MNGQQNSYPYIEIIEQPASKAIRFRYECEGRSAGSIPGENSDSDNKTFPSIRIVGFEGRAVIVISCVTKNRPYMPHPHSIVGRETCSRGICTTEIYSQQKPIIFSNLGIQCVKKRDIEEALAQRADIRVDPFKTGFDFKERNIDLSVVRLCFQVFLEGRNGKFQIPLHPVVSNPIYDKKSMNDLSISKLSHCSAPLTGGMEMIVLCEKILKDNIQIVFYEEQNDQIVWRAFADFTPSDVHKQTAISFRTPKYPINSTTAVQVYIQLRKPSDGSSSDPLPFTLIPSETVGETTNSLKRKRQRLSTSGPIDSPSPVFHRPDCKCTCQEGASAIPPSNVNVNVPIPKESYGVKLLKQLEAEVESRIEQQTLENRQNQQRCTRDDNVIDKSELVPLKNVVPSIFTPRFMQNQSNSRWNNCGNQASQMPSTSYQNKVASQPMVQSNLQCMPSTSYRLSPPSYSLPPVQEQSMQMTDQNEEQAPVLYRITKPENRDPMANVLSPIDLNSNQFNLDINPLEVLRELNSADLAGLSETFSEAFSLADPAEKYRLITPTLLDTRKSLFGFLTSSLSKTNIYEPN